MIDTIILGCLLLVSIVALAIVVSRLRKARVERRTLEQSHAAQIQRFQSIVDVDVERQRVLHEIDTLRAIARSEIAQASAQNEAEGQRVLREIETLRAQANASAAQARAQHEAERQRALHELEALRAQVDASTAQARTQNETERRRINSELAAERERQRTELERARHDHERALLNIQQQRAQAALELQSYQSRIETLRQEFKLLDEESNIQAFGFYKPRYDFSESGRYQAKLDEIRERQKLMLKDKTAAVCAIEWTVNGSKSEGKKQINQTLKLMLRAFNGECDATTAKVKYNNIGVMESRIRKAHSAINSLAQVQQSTIADAYLKLKLQELYLVHEYEEKLQEEKMEQRRIREQMREEEIALREIEKARQEAEKEELRYEEALRKAQEDIERATGAKQQKLQAQIEELERKLAEAHTNKERALSRAQMTRSGHVYVISNLGSFGEQVYKIGMTRRLDPMDRVKELGDASVPFEFDVHAIIYTEDAPALENKLHRAFHHRRVNRINERKEFFRLELREIVEFVRVHHTTEIEIVPHAEAKEYRKTQALLQQEEAPYGA